MALPAPDTSDDWTALIGAAAETQMTCQITIFDPDNSASVPYDPETDTGGYDGPAIIAAGLKARVVFIRAPQEVNTAVDWSTNRAARIQIPLTAVSTFIRKGLLIRVTAIGTADDPILLALGFIVESAVNGSAAAVRTIECKAQMSNVPVTS